MMGEKEMSFIGFCVDKKQENIVEQELKKITPYPAIAINEKSITNIKNVKFETIIINHNVKKLQNKEEFKKIIANAKYIIVNSDKVDLKILQDLNAISITYGFNGKATVTMSSIEDEELILCLQRNITTLQNKKIEPQEIRIDKKKFSLELDVIIGLCVTELLYAA